MGTAKPDAIFVAGAEVLMAAAELGAGSGPAHAGTVRDRMLDLLRGFVARCRDEGVPDAETAEARYAIVAFIDDRILKSNWPGRAEWQNSPLQLHFYREFTAGENFYHRMRGLIERGEPVFALEIYYLCLGLGFVGAIPSGGGQQATRGYVESARSLLLRGRSAEDIAPSAIPTERHRAQPRQFPVALTAVCACLVLCLLGLVGLQVALGRTLDSTAKDLAAAKMAPSPWAGGR
jgi:type IV/VI secretion system ImpK/VasF family protein